MSDCNMRILSEVACFLRGLRGPCIIGGDFNMTPQVLAESAWLREVGGVIVAPSLPTCNGATYDFFVVSQGFAASVVGAARLADAGGSPHWGARLVIRSKARRPLVTQMVRPPKVGPDLPLAARRAG